MRSVVCNVYHSRSCGWAGSGRAARLRTWSRMFCTSSTSVPRAASAASSCSCKQRCVASPVGPWAGGARAGLTGAVRGAAAAHAIDAVLLLHHDGSTWYCICLATVAGRGGASCTWWRGGRACSSGLGGAVWSGAAYHRHVQRVEREQPRDHAVRVARARPWCQRFISDRRTHLAL